MLSTFSSHLALLPGLVTVARVIVALLLITVLFAALWGIFFDNAGHRAFFVLDDASRWGIMLATTILFPNTARRLFPSHLFTDNAAVAVCRRKRVARFFIAAILVTAILIVARRLILRSWAAHTLSLDNPFTYDPRLIAALTVNIIMVINNHSAGIYHLDRMANRAYVSMLAAAGHGHGGYSSSG